MLKQNGRKSEEELMKAGGKWNEMLKTTRTSDMEKAKEVSILLPEDKLHRITRWGHVARRRPTYGNKLN